MKRLVILLLPLLLAACSVQEEDVIYFELSKETLNFDWRRSASEIQIDTNAEWAIVSDTPFWLSVERVSEKSISIIAEENLTRESRICRICFSVGLNEYYLAVEQKVQERLVILGEKEILSEAQGDEFIVKIDQNIPYYVRFSNQGEEWISCNASNLFPMIGDKNVSGPFSGEILSLKVQENPSHAPRSSEVIIYNEKYLLSDTLLICQAATSGRRYADGEYRILSRGINERVNLVLMGDGFTAKDLGRDGLYQQAMEQAVQYFFSVEPYKTYKDYFNVYMVAAESEHEGVGEKGMMEFNSLSNKFGSAYGSGTEVVCDSKLVMEYARKVEEIPDDVSITVIVVLNSDKYAGTTYLYADGNSIALCPMSTQKSPNDFEGLIHHEAGGHAFGFLCDEYVYYDKPMPKSRIENLKEWQELGFQMNLDFTNDLSTILWKDFVGIKKYEKVGAYEGGYEYQYGVWRSEENSCMNNNVPYFNVQSRWSIVNRIMKLADKEFSVQDFMKADNPVLPDAATRSAAEKAFRPLGAPIWIK